MSSSDFFARLERQLVEAAERDLVASPARRRLAGLADRLRPRRLVVAVPLAAAALLVGVIAALVLSLGGEQPRIEAGRGAAAPSEPTGGLSVEPLGTAPQTGTAIPLPVPPPRPGSAPRAAVPLPLAPNAPRPIPTGPSVFLLNATGKDGTASAAAVRLQRAGVDVEGTGNAPSRYLAKLIDRSSVVYADVRSRTRTTAQRLGIAVTSTPIPRELRAVAPAAEVIVVLGTDFVPPTNRQVNLTGRGGAVGVAVLSEDGGLAFTASKLPPSDHYFLWGENPAGDDVPVGFATYDKRSEQVAGNTQALPPSLSFETPQRIFLTREKTDQPKSPGNVVLDSGRIGG